VTDEALGGRTVRSRVARVRNAARRTVVRTVPLAVLV
jgi:hypothetical protein